MYVLYYKAFILEMFTLGDTLCLLLTLKDTLWLGDTFLGQVFFWLTEKPPTVN